MVKNRKTQVVQPTAGAFERLKHAGIECGIDARSMKQLVVRLQVRPPAKLDDKELLALIDDRLARAFAFLDDFTLGQASARDLTVNIGILTDKRQLLRGEPTVITRLEDVKKMDELGAMLVTEMKRRGKIIDVTPEQAKDQPDSITGPNPA